MKKVLFLMAALGCSFAGISQTSKSFNVSNFNRLDIGSAFTINVTKGPFKVVASGRDEELKELVADVNNGELSIHYKDSKGWNMWNNRKDVTLTITMPALRAIDFSGATTSKISGFTSKQFDIDLSGASNSVIDVSADVVTVECSGASDLVLRGDADQLKVNISGASELKANDFKVSEAVVEASGASDAKLNVLNKLVANASGASDIRYRGKVSNVKKSSSGSSSVKLVE